MSAFTSGMDEIAGIAESGLLDASLDSQHLPHQNGASETSQAVAATCFETCPICGKHFTPVHRTKGYDTVCSKACRKAGESLARKLGWQMIRSLKAGTQVRQAMKKLEAGLWVAPNVPVFRDAVRKLRDKGHKIDCRRRYNDQLQRTEYQYKLRKSESK